MFDPRDNNINFDEETIEILEIIEDCKESYDFEEDYIVNFSDDNL